jgi:hypothetical protein
MDYVVDIQLEIEILDDMEIGILDDIGNFSK